MLAGKKTYLGIAILVLCGLIGIDPAATLASAGIEADADMRVIAQAIGILVGAAIAVYGRWKASQLSRDSDK